MAQPDGGGEDWSKIEPTARQIDYEYSRLNRAAGKARDAVHILLKIHDAMSAKVSGRLEVALEVSPILFLVSASVILLNHACSIGY